MAINPHRKGGTDVPVSDGGTGASDPANALTNLGGLDVAAHAVIDHSGIPGAGVSAVQRLTLPAGFPHGTWDPGQATLGTPANWIVGGGFNDPISAITGGMTAATGAGPHGTYTRVNLAPPGGNDWSVHSDARVDNVGLSRVVFKIGANLNFPNINEGVEVRLGFTSNNTPTPGGGDFAAAANAIWFFAPPAGAGVRGPWQVERRVASVLQAATPSTVPSNSDAALYFLIEYTSPTDVLTEIYDSAGAQLFSTSFSGAPNVPQMTDGRLVLQVDDNGDGNASRLDFYGAILSHGG